MFTVRKTLWYIQTFARKYARVIIISTIIGLGVFIALPRVLALFPTVKKTTYIGRVGLFTFANLPRDIQNKVSVGLTQSRETGDVLPALASSFVSEENGKAYRFIIRPDAVWQDGQAVHPADITYSFSDLEILRSQNDIVFRLKPQEVVEGQPEPVIPVSFLTVVSQPLFRQVPKRTLFFRQTSRIIGLGEYEITSIRYRGATIRELTLESPKERLIYRFYPTEHDAVVAFKHGVIDKLEEMHDIEDLASWDNVTRQLTRHDDRYVGVFFNLGYRSGDTVLFAARTLRTALNLAIQKTQGSDRILSPIHKRSWAYVASEDDLDHFNQDMTEAVNQLVASETTVPLTFELTTIPLYAKKAEEITHQWEMLGELAVQKCKETDAPQDQCDNKRISVDVRINNFPDPENYQALLIAQPIPNDPDQYGLWHSTQQTNFTKFKNTRVDKLLEDGRRIQNREERKLLYQEFQRILVKETPVIFLEPVSTYTVVRKSSVL